MDVSLRQEPGMRAVTLGRAGLVVLAGLAGRGPLDAQAAPALDRGALTAFIDSASRIRVRLPMGWANIDEPRLQRDSLQFRRGTTLDRGGRIVPVQPPLALADIAEIRVPAGHASGKGAAWGAGIGAGLGLVLAIGAALEPQCIGCPTNAEGF